MDIPSSKYFGFLDDSDDDLDLNKPIKPSLGINTPPPSSPPLAPLSSERCSKRRLIAPSQHTGIVCKLEADEHISRINIESRNFLEHRHNKVPQKSPSHHEPKHQVGAPHSKAQTRSDTHSGRTKKAPGLSGKVIPKKKSAIFADKPVPSSIVVSSVVTRIGARAASIPQKRKRKEIPFKLCPENERIFAGKTFFFIPADDVAPLRRSRIAKAQSHGALWTKEWIPSITHVVVDKTLNYIDIINYLKPTIKSDTLPSNIILVNDEYPNDCVNFRILLSPYQKKYLVASKIENECFIPQTSLKQLENCPTIKMVGSERTQLLVSQTMNRSVSHAETGSADKKMSSHSQLLGEDQIKIHEEEKLMEPRSTGTKVRPTKPRDDLDEMVQIASKLQHLPIDDEEESNSFGSQEPEMDLDSDEEETKKIQARKLKYGKKKLGHFKQEYTCMKGTKNIFTTANPNSQTLGLLQEMSEYYDRIRDEWRSRAYKLAIMTLKKQPTKIISYEEAIQLPNIGHRLAMKIEEIVLTHRLRRLDNAMMEPTDLILQRFLKIYGVGLSQASKWVAAGYKTLEDLKSSATLSENQRVGIDHFEDFNTRIPRAEVTALAEIVRKAVAKLDQNVEVIIGGSYRRGAATCGDIDVIITRPGTETVKSLLPFLSDLVAQLTQTKFLVAALAVPGPQGSKWHGACVLPGNTIWRRIDFLVVPATERGAALLYFTGDDIFNRSIRLLSRKKGMRLNQHGLYRDVMRGPGCVKLNEGTLVEAADEKRIFEVLGVPWRCPEERICH